MNEQLSLFGASDHQMHFTHAHYGVLEFYHTRTNEWKETCRRCLLWNSPECKDAPCSAFERRDHQEGYFSIHQIPE